MNNLLRIFVSPVAWLASFSAVYGLHGLLCALDPGAIAHMSWSRLLMALAFGVALLLQIGLLSMLYSGRFGATTSFTRTVSRASGWTGLVATTWTLFPTLSVTVC